MPVQPAIMILGGAATLLQLLANAIATNEQPESNEPLTFGVYN